MLFPFVDMSSWQQEKVLEHCLWRQPLKKGMLKTWYMAGLCSGVHTQWNACTCLVVNRKSIQRGVYLYVHRNWKPPLFQFDWFFFYMKRTLEQVFVSIDINMWTKRGKLSVPRVPNSINCICTMQCGTISSESGNLSGHRNIQSSDILLVIHWNCRFHVSFPSHRIIEI